MNYRREKVKVAEGKGILSLRDKSLSAVTPLALVNNILDEFASHGLCSDLCWTPLPQLQRGCNSAQNLARSAHN